MKYLEDYLIQTHIDGSLKTINYSGDFEELQRKTELYKNIKINASSQQKIQIQQHCAEELLKIKSSYTKTFWLAIGLFAAGALFYLLYWVTGLQSYISHTGGPQEFIIVFMWVFVWTGVDRMFFTLPKLRKQRKILLRIAEKIID